MALRMPASAGTHAEPVPGFKVAPPRTRFVFFGGARIETFLLSADDVAVSKLSRGMADRSAIFLQFVLKASGPER